MAFSFPPASSLPSLGTPLVCPERPIMSTGTNREEWWAMRIVLFGATGMIGQGVLRECLFDPEVEAVLAIGRRTTAKKHDKLCELAHDDFTDFSAIEGNLAGYDACFFCLGVSSAGMSETDYTRVTYDFTLAAARVLARLNPNMTFVYISGAGADSSERGRSMWARVKGRTENALLALPFQAYVFRPALIQPRHGIVSRTRLYRVFYAVLAPLYPLLRRLCPRLVTNTEQVGRAMLAVAKRGYPKRVLETPDINTIV
jgi:uncharacterized protein YbjT (DUF2867 family)